ncbi:helix-turn-helix domain-containing protein [Patescibacteria group bacterium]
MAQTVYITIQEAAKISKKSVQTIRRALKSRKLKHRKRKTPQGFNYMISRESLFDIYNLQPEIIEVVKKEDKSIKAETKEKNKEKKSDIVKKEDEVVQISSNDFNSFKSAFEKMISNHSEERQNFLRLINTLQEKIFVLENQVNLLKAPQKRWYQVWK